MADVIIIGADVVGLAAAFRLAGDNAHSVQVIDPFTTTGHEQGSGLVAPQSDCILHAQGPSLPLMLRAREELHSFTLDVMAASGLPIHWWSEGVMVLSSDDAETRKFSDGALEQTKNGLRAYVLDPISMVEMEPRLCQKLVGGAYLPEDSALDLHQYTAAIETGLREMGVVIRRNTPIDGLHMVGGRIQGIRTPNEILPADFVILCDGEQTQTLLASCGVHIALKRSQQTHLLADRGSDGPRHILCTKEMSLIPSANDLMLCGESAREEPGTSPLVQDIQQWTTAGTALFPPLSSRAVRNIRAVVSASISDGVPCIGQLAQVEGLVVAIGLAHRSTLLSALAGDWIRRSIEGEQLPQSADDVAPERRASTTQEKPKPEKRSDRGSTPIYIPPV